MGKRGSQLQVFNEVESMIQSGLNGHNVCIFAYGQQSATLYQYSNCTVHNIYSNLSQIFENTVTYTQLPCVQQLT